MEIADLQALLGALPGGGIACLALWFAWKKDAQCTALMQQMTELVKSSTASAGEVKASLDAIREAIRTGTRS